MLTYFIDIFLLFYCLIRFHCNQTISLEIITSAYVLENTQMGISRSMINTNRIFDFRMRKTKFNSRKTFIVTDQYLNINNKHCITKNTLQIIQNISYMIKLCSSYVNQLEGYTFFGICKLVNTASCFSCKNSFLNIYYDIHIS